MGKYIRQFATAAEQAAAPEINPAVDWIKETDEVVYTPYEPPFTGKVKLTYSDGSVYTAACDSITTLSSADTKPAGYQYSAVTKAEVGECVMRIFNETFYQFSGLTSVTISDSVTQIDSSAFQECVKLGYLDIPSGVTTIGGFAFYNTKSLLCLTFYSTTPPSLQNNALNGIGSGATIFVPDDVVDIYKQSSVFNGLSERIKGVSSRPQESELYPLIITYSDGVKYINSDFSKIYLLISDLKPDGYDYNEITSIEIGYPITGCANDVVVNYDKLTTLTLGQRVSFLGDRAIQNCSGLTSITVKATTPPSLGNNVFNNTNNCPIYVPAASVDAYKSAWSDYANRIQAIPTT